MIDAAIIGAGASGLVAGIRSQESGIRGSGGEGGVVLFERLPRAGKKILATGNGRCNLGNAHAPDHLYHNRAFALPALQKFDIRTFFRSLGLLLREDAEGRLYPRSNTAASVLDALRLGVLRCGVEICCGTPIDSIEPAGEGFLLNGTIAARRVVIAAGGCAAPAQGSDGSGFSLLKQLGHAVVEPRPALVPLTCDSPLLPMLGGMRCRAEISIEQNGSAVSSAEGEILFARDGISGIAAMEVSRHALPGSMAVLDLLPEFSLEQTRALLSELARACPEQPLAGILPGLLPRRIGEAALRAGGDPAVNLKRFVFSVTGTRGFAQAQVTAGGADVAQFNSETMESRLHKNLYACGEVLDVDGGCGGFNLHWAFASGWAAGGGRCCEIDIPT